MIWKRYKDVKSQLARIAGVTGRSPSDPSVLALVNRAQEELIDEGEWPGVVDRLRAKVLDGNIVVPDEFISVQCVSADDVYHPVRNRWFELMDYGPGRQDGDRRTAGIGCLDKGVTTVFSNLPEEDGPWRLKIRSDRTEAEGSYILIRGLDDRGKRLVTTEDGVGEFDGEKIPLPPAGGLALASRFLWTEIDTSPGGVLIEGAKGEITLSATNGTAEVILAHYPRGIEAPQFRRYFIPGLTPNMEHTVVLKVFRKFKPVEGEDDFLMVSNMVALELMMLGLRAKDNDEIEDYINRKRLAIDALVKQRRRYDGPGNVAIGASVDFGLGFAGVT